jgi:sulfite reductase beta subunit-like hemoprotein
MMVVVQPEMSVRATARVAMRAGRRIDLENIFAVKLRFASCFNECGCVVIGRISMAVMND